MASSGEKFLVLAINELSYFHHSMFSLPVYVISVVELILSNKNMASIFCSEFICRCAPVVFTENWANPKQCEVSNINAQNSLLVFIK